MTAICYSQLSGFRSPWGGAGGRCWQEAGWFTAPPYTHTLYPTPNTHTLPLLSAQAFGFACATPFPIPSVSSVFLSKFKLCLFPSSYIPTLNLHMFLAPLLHSLYSRTSCNLASYGIRWTSMERAEDTRKQPTESRTVPMYLNRLNIIAPDCSNFSIQTSFVHCEVQGFKLCAEVLCLYSLNQKIKSLTLHHTLDIKYIYLEIDSGSKSWS